MGVLRIRVGGQWIDVPGGVGGGGGGGGSDEVVISTTDPIDAYPTTELWFDPDATAPSGGPSGPVSYRHVQGTSSATWTIVHNLGFYPNIIIEDSGGSTVEGETVWNDLNTVTVTFSVAFSGVAYLS